MKNSNVCFFIPKQEPVEELFSVHFVLETSLPTICKPKLLSLYHLYLVVEGNAVLHSRTHDTPLCVGDIFFGLPAVPFSIEPSNNFKYIYISYFGKRANYLAHKLSIHEKNCVFHGFHSLIDLWKNSLAIPMEVAQLRSESLLLYTFSVLFAQYSSNKQQSKTDDVSERVKSYIEEHFTDPQISLNSISKALAYNPKYLSSLFKSTFHVGISDYIITKRIQYAFTLMHQGISLIKNVASLCGFQDPLYFSKVFKQNTGISPRKYLQQISISHLQ